MSEAKPVNPTCGWTRPASTPLQFGAETHDPMCRAVDERVSLPPPSRLALTSAVVFAGCTLMLPIVCEELYPFTIAPMFRDSPRLYCRYRVLDPQGVEFALRDFELQRNYDGNPVGLGAGVLPPPTLDEFGAALDEATLRAHVSRILRGRFPGISYVDVEQTVIGPVDRHSIGVVSEARFRVHPDGT